jgi:membrane-anchored protein YejM (alkaline phosphatase superfamily)
MSERTSRKTLLRWAGWFALANSLVFGVVSLRYFSGGLPASTPLSLLYLFSVYVGHHVLLTVVPMIVLGAPIIAMVPRRRVLTAAAVLLYALMIALMMLDSLLWSQSRFHINALTMKILGWQSWFFAAVIFGIGLVFEALLARAVWNWVQATKRRRGPLLGAVCGLLIIVSQSIHAWADASYYVPVTGLGQVLPVYKGVTAKSFFSRTGLVDVEKSRERELARRISQGLDQASGRVLNYPANPLRCSGGGGLNLLLIVADSMRGSVLTPELAPNRRAWVCSACSTGCRRLIGAASPRCRGRPCSSMSCRRKAISWACSAARPCTVRWCWTGQPSPMYRTFGWSPNRRRTLRGSGT